jgi:hypothetical protein
MLNRAFMWFQNPSGKAAWKVKQDCHTKHSGAPFPRIFFGLGAAGERARRDNLGNA